MLSPLKVLHMKITPFLGCRAALMITFIIWLLETIWAETHAIDPPSAMLSGGIPSENAFLVYLPQCTSLATYPVS